MSVSGKYKGHRFRSLLELSFMLKMEGHGHILGETLLYEALTVQYFDGKRTRRYIVDFYAPKDRSAFELTWSTHRGRRKKVMKASAAINALTERGILYFVEDETMMKRVTLAQAAAMHDVQLDPRSARRAARLKRGKIKKNGTKKRLRRRS